MADFELTDAARADLKEIYSFGFDTFGEQAADAYAAGLRHAFDLLADYPLSAPERVDCGPGVRCRPFRSHLILHVFDGARVLIVRVLHHSQDMARHFRP